MSTAVEDVEALFAEVGQVQKELEKFDVKRAVDANEIYELLETHSFRTDRVQFVTTHLLVTLGLRNQTEDVIDVSDDSYDDDDVDDDLDDVHYTSSPEYPILNEPAVLDLSMSDSHPAEEISFQNDANENVNSDTDNIYVNDEAQDLPVVLPCLPSDDPFYEKNYNFEMHETDIPVTADNSVTENSIMIPSATVESTGTYLKTQSNTDTSSVDCIPRSGYQSEDFTCDVNNNDPNNNTEYDILQPEVVEEHNSFVREMDDSGLEFEDQDEIRCKLLDEAKLIHRIVPRQNLEQIYSFLEANLDRKNRVQIVMQEFLRMELSDSGDIVINDSVDSSSKDTNYSSNIILKRESLLEPCTSSKENIKMIKNAVETSVLTGSQQCTSTNTKALESLDIESLPSTSWFKRTNITKDISRNMNGGTKRSSKDLKYGDNKKINIPLYEQIPTSYSDLETSDLKKTDVSEVSSTSVPSEFTDQNVREEIAIYNSGDVGITSTSNLKMCLIRDPKGEGKFAVKSFTQSVEEDENNVETESNRVPTIEPVIPSSSTENSSSDERSASTEGKNKRKSEPVDDYSPIKIKKTELNQSNLEEGVSINKIVLTENQRKYRSRLMEMFPNADPLYLQQQCYMIETEESLIDIITRLVETDDYPRRQKPVQDPDEPQPGPSDSALPDEEKTEMQYQILVSILPNADPMYLRENCEKIGNDEDAMKTFVANALEKGDYPTREEYDKRQKALDQRKKYTEQFSVEGFLEVLPDPFKYFTEEKKSNHNIIHHALPFLKGRYKKIRQQDLLHVLKANSYNLTVTCQQLDEFIGNLRRSKRSEYECRIPAEVNVPFLQEVAFIENKHKIKKYLKEKADRKKEAFEEAKAKGELLECGCCFDNEVMLEDMAACNEGHLFCKDCIRKGAEVLIGDGKTSFPCLNDCEAEFSLKTLQMVLKPSVFSKMLLRKQLEEVKAADIEDLETCPFCDFASIPPREDKVFRCMNPECMRESCRNCREPNHIPLRCEEVEKPDEVKTRTYIEDRMTEALVRTCWKCGKKFIKESGCNKMTCTCGALMCYICRQPVKDYSHFNGQGGDSFHKCPLYSTNDAVHVDAVRKAAQKVKEELESKNPDLKLKHDPTKILPAANGQNERGFPLHFPFPFHNVFPGLHHHHHNHHNHHPHRRRRIPDPYRILVEPVGDVGGIEMAVRVLAGRVEVPFGMNYPDRQRAQRRHEPHPQPQPHPHPQPVNLAHYAPPRVTPENFPYEEQVMNVLEANLEAQNLRNNNFENAIRLAPFLIRQLQEQQPPLPPRPPEDNGQIPALPSQQPPPPPQDIPVIGPILAPQLPDTPPPFAPTP